MASERETGGPAFPVQEQRTTINGTLGGVPVGTVGNFSAPGMTMRDWLAGKAMQGLVHDILIDQHWEDVLLKKGLTVDEFPPFLAHLSYMCADAMLAERNK